MPSQSVNVFVSYSHADASLVAPIVKLLRLNKSLVFRDIEGIRPGKKWRTETARGLAASHLVVVFWCGHARQSDEVAKEWKAAIEQDKDLLPLLLDSTPLPPELGEFQWIDFRGTVGPNHSSIASSADDVKVSAPPSVKSGRWLSLAGVAAVFVAAVALSLFTQNAPQLPSPSPTPRPPVQTPLPWPFDLLLNKDILLSLALLFAVAAWLAWWLRRRSRRGRSIEDLRPHPHELERRIASEIETEILRRAASRQDGGA